MNRSSNYLRRAQIAGAAYSVKKAEKRRIIALRRISHKYLDQDMAAVSYYLRLGIVPQSLWEQG